MSSEILIKAESLTKKFDDFLAVDNIDFQVLKGECFGFLGPNGAGKTTTMRMVQCVLPLTGGSLQVSGMNVTEREEKLRR